MNGITVVIGYGAVGRAVVEALRERGDAVRVAQRTRPADLPGGVSFVACDVLDAAAVRRAVDGAAQVVLAVGLPYDARVWRRVWPASVRNVIDACAAPSGCGARLVFVDNLYMLGPQTAPRREDMPLSDAGDKPAILSEVTRLWMSARDRVRFASLRCTDFYGPGVTVSHLGESAFGALAKGDRAAFIVPPDTRHDFAYVPDIARAVTTLLDAPDDAFGQAWNMPCAPTRTPREILRLGADAAGVEARTLTVPFVLLPFLGLFSRFMKEVVDVGFTWDRPYEVDGSKLQQRFQFEVTPYQAGAAATARWFVERERSGASRPLVTRPVTRPVTSASPTPAAAAAGSAAGRSLPARARG